MMARNVRLYPAWQACRNLIFWLPIFFLYFASVLRIDQVLLLEALYYVGVVVLEIPSGYFSDRVQRRATLLVASCAWIVAYLVFVATGSFVPFATAQLLLALGMAFNSGTDTALLYDSLVELGRQDEIAEQEARGQSWGLAAIGFSAVVGGLLAGLDLRFAYALSALGGSLAWAVAWHFSEPPRHGASALEPLRQLQAVLSRLRDPALRWVFIFVVAMTVFNHVPYEFFQPWLELLFAQLDRPLYSVTPAAAGLLMGASFGISAWASNKAPAVQRRFGARRGLLAVLAAQTTVMVAMAVAIHPVVVVILLLQSVAQALVGPITLSIIHPRIDSGMRATYLSLQSLAGRLAFSLSLVVAAIAVGGVETLDHPLMRTVLMGYVAVAAAVGLLLWRLPDAE